MEKLVSVVIPTFNGESTILRSVNSVLNQTYRNIELLVVLDMPFDGTDAILEKIKDVRVKILKVDKKVNGSYARNIGINSAKGEYVAFLDDDDEWMSNKIKKQVEFLESNDHFGATISDFIYSRNGKYQYYITKSKDYIKDIFLMRRKLQAGSNILMYTKYAKELNGFDINFVGHQDLEFMIRVEREYKVGHTAGYLVKCYGNSGRAASNTDKLIKAKELFLIKFKELIEEFPKYIQRKIYARQWLQVARAYSINGDNQNTMKYLGISLSYSLLLSNKLIVIPAESYFLILINYVKNILFRKY